DDLVDHLVQEHRLEVRDTAEAGPAALEADLPPLVVGEKADDAESPVRMRLGENAATPPPWAGPPHEGGGEVEAPRAHAAGEQAERDLLARQEGPVDHAEEDEEPAADEVQPEPENEEDEDRRSAEGDARGPPHLLAEGQRPVAPI